MSDRAQQNPPLESNPFMSFRTVNAPRLVIAGTSGSCGKTLLSLGLILLTRRIGVPTAAFKKGPDYIDAGWLSWASGSATRNLDTYLMGKEVAVSSFISHADSRGLNLIEGNRGLFDGFDARGTHSTAELAKMLDAPVLLVVNSAKVTRTVAAIVLGCRTLDPAVRIGGVILNRVAGARHEAVLKEAVESACDVPVLGSLPRHESGELLPDRHLGLVTPQEHHELDDLVPRVLSLVEGRLDLHRIVELANSAPPLVAREAAGQGLPNGKGLRIGFLKDSAFTFYYPENLEMVRDSGTELVPISTCADSTLPEDLDALYIGGGFPETHAAAISRNASMLESLRHHALAGLPVYAECGGLMLLSRALRWKGQGFRMAGVLPFETEVCETPQGHGYVDLVVDHPNPFYSMGTVIRGHEFHFSRIVPTSELPPTACAVRRGTGSFEGRDGILRESVWASYSHVHALATPEWVHGLIGAARRFSSLRRAGEHHSLFDFSVPGSRR